MDRRTILALALIFAFAAAPGIVAGQARTAEIQKRAIQERIDAILARIAFLRTELDRIRAEGGNEIGAAGVGTAISGGLSCLSLSRTLAVGSSGEDVRRLQRFLIEAGMLDSGNDTAFFGPLTEGAVKRWQAARGVVSSGSPATTGYGIVGPKTRASMLESCSRAAVLPDAAGSACPVVPPLTEACEGLWEKKFAADGCLSGYRCVSAEAGASYAPPEKNGVTIRYATTSIAVGAPGRGFEVAIGDTMRIAWESVNPPPGTAVTLLLESARGKRVGDIATDLPATGSFDWRLPGERAECGSDEGVLKCAGEPAGCPAGGICSVSPGSYAIVASLGGAARAASELFDIFGTGVSETDAGDVFETDAGDVFGTGTDDVLDDFTDSAAEPLLSLGAGLSSMPGTVVEGSASGSDSCEHEGQSYTTGSTLSVPCVFGNCPSSGTGFITGVCEPPRWCVPSTSYCAEVLTSIDVSAYEGGGAAPIGTGHAINCGTPGWRAYLTCTHGGCTTGWHICSGGSWVYDPSQKAELADSCKYYDKTFADSQTAHGNPCPAQKGECPDALKPILSCRKGTWYKVEDGKSVCEQIDDGSLDALSSEEKKNTLEYLEAIGCKVP